MNIGIDISILQTPHRLRGIGATLINFINHISDEQKSKNSFTFFHYPITEDNDPLHLLNLDGLDYKLVEITPKQAKNLKLPGKINLVSGLLTKALTLLELYNGDARIKDVENLDYFLQFDPNQPVPNRGKVKSALVLYDLIPYVLETYYTMWSYRTARRKGMSRKRALIFYIKRKLFRIKNKILCSRPDKLIAISHHTKNDYVKYIGVKENRITVCHLGVIDAKTVFEKPESFTNYLPSSWGDIPKKLPTDALEGNPFILFVGGADPRRKLVDLLAAYNNLRARGENVSLVLAGDSMLGANTVPNDALRAYIRDNSSYMDRVYFLGFVDESQKNWLYLNCLAFVWPSIYEGFGLPVLEAMQQGAPVITFNNSSIPEIAGESVIYASNYAEIANELSGLLANPKYRKKLTVSGKNHAAKYPWTKTTNEILKLAR